MSADHRPPGLDDIIKSEKRIAEARAKLQGQDLVDFERSVEVAEGIKIILLAVDIAVLDRHMSAPELRKMAGKMRERNGSLEAWPFPEMLNLATRRGLELDVFDAIANLVKARQIWREKRDLKPFATGADVLSLLGEDSP